MEYTGSRRFLQSCEVERIDPQLSSQFPELLENCAKTFKCRVCGVPFKGVFMRWEHEVKIHLNYQVVGRTCQVCNKVEPNFSEFAKHLAKPKRKCARLDASMLLSLPRVTHRDNLPNMLPSNPPPIIPTDPVHFPEESFSSFLALLSEDEPPPTQFQTQPYLSWVVNEMKACLQHNNLWKEKWNMAFPSH